MNQNDPKLTNTVIGGPGSTILPYTPTYPTYPTLPASPNDNNYNASTNYISVTGRPVIKALNGVVLCEPFKTNTVKKKERNAFATLDQKVTLAPLMVLVGNAEIPTGSTVYVRGEACQMGWGKEVFESDTIPQFIRVPVTDIVFMKGYEQNPWGYTWALNNGVANCQG